MSLYRVRPRQYSEGARPGGLADLRSIQLHDVRGDGHRRSRIHSDAALRCRRRPRVASDDRIENCPLLFHLAALVPEVVRAPVIQRLEPRVRMSTLGV